MSLLVKIKNFLGLDIRQDYLWLNSKENSENLTGSHEISETCRLTGNCKSNLILSEGVCLSVENEFEGIIIGKKNCIVRITNSFIGLIACEFLICSTGAKVKGDIYIEKLAISEGIDFNVSANQKRLEEMIDPKLSDLNNISVKEYKEKYFID